mmetsp:Transcript_9796/g.14161  ORF Transcript_9796/g.14161 Transcript_9796/m.14161 type:complete len:332 (-) Transcript_9796:505-1500(-)
MRDNVTMKISILSSSSLHCFCLTQNLLCTTFFMAILQAFSATIPPSILSRRTTSSFKTHFFSSNNEQNRGTFPQLLLLQLRGGSDYQSSGLGKRPQSNNYDEFGHDRQPGYEYGYGSNYAEDEEQWQQYQRSDIDGGIDPYGSSPSNPRRQRRSDNYYSGSSRAGLDPKKIPGVSLIANAGNRKLGILLASIGAALTLFGISLFFNKTLLRMGNLLFIAGVPLILGPGRTAGYFLQPAKARATGCLIFGIFFVFVGRPILGMMLEIFGLLNLFGNLFPLIMVMLRQVPFLGELLPNGNGGNKRRAAGRRDYYDDQNYYDDGRTRENVEKYY